jgi:hypothetical protein
MKQQKKPLSRLPLIFLMVTLFGCLFYFSCTEDWSNPDNEANAPLSVNSARQWFQRNYGTKVETRTSADNDSIVTIIPVWQEAKAYKKGNESTVEVRIMCYLSTFYADVETGEHLLDGEKIDSLYNLVRMVVYKNQKTNVTRSFLMTFVGSYEYLTSKKSLRKNSYLKRASDLDGSVFFHTLDRQFINGWVYTKGKIVNELLAGETSDSGVATRSTTRGGANCYMEWDQWLVGYIIDGEFHQSYIIITNLEVSCMNEGSLFPGGGGGSNPGGVGGNSVTGGSSGSTSDGGSSSNTSPQDSPKIPCNKAKELSSSTEFRNAIEDLLDKTQANTGKEDGWVKTKDGKLLKPTNLVGRTQYSTQQMNELNGTHSITERYHSHPESLGSSPYFSWGDLWVLARDYVNGRIDESNFSYGVVSQYGSFSLVISDKSKFEAFAQKLYNKDAKLYNAYQKMLSNRIRNGADGTISKFMSFLYNNLSGLNAIYRRTQWTNINGVDKIIWKDSDWIVVKSIQDTSEGEEEQYKLESVRCLQ